MKQDYSKYVVMVMKRGQESYDVLLDYNYKKKSFVLNRLLLVDQTTV